MDCKKCGGHENVSVRAIEFINSEAGKQQDKAEEIEYRKQWEAKH